MYHSNPPKPHERRGAQRWSLRLAARQAPSAVGSGDSVSPRGPGPRGWTRTAGPRAPGPGSARRPAGGDRVARSRPGLAAPAPRLPSSSRSRRRYLLGAGGCSMAAGGRERGRVDREGGGEERSLGATGRTRGSTPGNSRELGPTFP